MSMNDTLSDLLTRIRNGHMAGKKRIVAPASKMHDNVLAVLQREGYIRGFEAQPVREGIAEVAIELKYHENEPVIKELRRVSTPGRRVYRAAVDLPKSFNGLGIYIVSTSKGVLSDTEARDQQVGGEVLCEVF